LLTFGSAGAQRLPAVWVSEDKPEVILPDSLEVENLSDTCHAILSKLHGLAYLEASIDSVKRSSAEIELFLHLGRKYRWSYLDLSAIPPPLQDQIKINIEENKLYSHAEIQALFERILTKAENQGYPFMAIRLDSIDINEGNIRAQVAINPNERITIERVRIEGDLKLSSRFLTHLIGMEEGDLFSRDKIIKAKDRLISVPFIKTNKDPSIDFLGKGATLNLFLDKKNANRFDILLGLLPTTGNETQRFRLTGNVDIDMANQFGAGEKFHLNFENLSPGTQNLSLALNYPFIFGWSFGADLQFDLYKRDSSYIDLGYEAGIQYFLKQDNYLQFFIENQRTNILTVDTNRIKQTRTLDQFLDITQNLFGVEYHVEKLDYRFNPRRGAAMTLKARAGTKKIKKNATIISLTDQNDPEFNYDDLYKDIDLNSFQYKINTNVEFYVPLFKSSAIKLGNTSGWVGSGQALYNNELYRIGGARLLRGFNEQSIFASLYSIFTAEYRLLFNQNSNIFVFTDAGFYNQNTNLTKSSDTPFGVGTGLNLETKVGVFAISYAIGREKNSPFTFRNGRIHFGMVSQF
jgi:outer membrane protein assembly factor BamA